MPLYTSTHPTPGAYPYIKGYKAKAKLRMASANGKIQRREKLAGKKSACSEQKNEDGDLKKEEKLRAGDRINKEPSLRLIDLHAQRMRMQFTTQQWLLCHIPLY